MLPRAACLLSLLHTGSCATRPWISPHVARTVNAEKPRSSVIPRSLLWGCLSRAAVDKRVDRAATAVQGVGVPKISLIVLIVLLWS